MVLFISSLQNSMPIRLFSHLMLKPRWNAIKWKGEIYTIQFHLDYFLNCFNICCYCFSSSIIFFLFLQLITFQLFLRLFRFHLDYFLNCFNFIKLVYAGWQNMPAFRRGPRAPAQLLPPCIYVFLDALASLKTMFKIKWVINSCSQD